MKYKYKRTLTIAGSLFLLFLLFTVVVAVIDVRPIGPGGAMVGLASINQTVFETVGVNLRWYEGTNWLGAVAILMALGFGILGLYQLVKRRSLFRVDVEITLLGCFYAILAVFYLVFEVVVVNERPILLDERLEASYPSSHTMMVTFVMGTAGMQFRRILGDKSAEGAALNGVCILLAAVMVMGRLLSGVHWVTDLVGGLLLSAALVMSYTAAVSYIRGRRKS